jgi:hypothetical protein
MTESPTSAFPVAEPASVGAAHDDVYPTTGTPPRRSPLPQGGTSDVKPEAPRRHPVAYLALALSIIALLWLAIWSSMSGGDDYQKVRVGSQDCVSVPQDNGPAALYCRTRGLTPP